MGGRLSVKYLAFSLGARAKPEADEEARGP